MRSPSHCSPLFLFDSLFSCLLHSKMSSGKAPRTAAAGSAPRRRLSSGAGPSSELAVWSADERIVMLVDSSREISASVKDLLSVVVHQAGRIQDLADQTAANTGRLDTMEERMTN